MTTQERFDLITRNTEEVLTAEDLKKFLDQGVPLKHYLGLEISGMIHLGTGIANLMKVKDFLDAGIDCTIFLADWHTWINDKLGGDLEVIKKVAVTYFKEGLIASFKCVGGDPKKLKFLLGTDLYHQADDYWATVIDVSKHVTLARVKRSLPIMGRKAEEGINFAMLIYPPMQVADIFFQGLTIAHAGIDQRTAHVIMRQVATKMKVSPVKDPNGKIIKPIAIHHPMILGLGKPPVWPVPKDQLQELWSEIKMTKSKPDTCLFVHDSPEEIRRKVGGAFCPPDEVDFNPIINWVEHLILREGEGIEFKVKRDQKHGGDITFKELAEVKEVYLGGKLHPQDLKNAVADYLIDLLEPARQHFASGAPQEALVELEKLTITR